LHVYLLTFLDNIFIGPLTGPIGCPETSVSKNLRSVTSQKSEDVAASTTDYRVQQFYFANKRQTLNRV
jgi:hypothetical protein